MKDNTCLVIDVWEGQLEIDEAVLKANGVAGIGIRLNDMNGGHHLDTGFVKQWEEAKGFVRFPYFVYNPWVNGTQNYVWLEANMPAEAKSVAIDVEVRFGEITPAKYAGELNKFLSLANSQWKTIIYTGQGYLNLLSKWPKCDYWWAQYPNPQTYFGGVKTWAALKKVLDNPALTLPFNHTVVPGTLKMWQFSGDYLILPGTVRDIDVNLFYGTEADLAKYFGTEQEIGSVENTEKITGTVIVTGVKVRSGPSIQSARLGWIYRGDVVIVIEIMNGFHQTWGKIKFDGMDAWVALEYFGQKFLAAENK